MKKTSKIVAGIATMLVAGCGDSSGPTLVPVKGTVMYKDKPLEGADVSFAPDSSNTNGLMGGDVTGPAGDYSALTNGRRGLVPGKYKVTVRKLTVSALIGPGGEVADPSPNRKKLELKYAQFQAEKAGKKTATLLPDNIEKIVGTFEREVPPEGGVIDFDVKLQARDTPAKQ